MSASRSETFRHAVEVAASEIALAYPYLPCDGGNVAHWMLTNLHPMTVHGAVMSWKYWLKWTQQSGARQWTMTEQISRYADHFVERKAHPATGFYPVCTDGLKRAKNF